MLVLGVIRMHGQAHGYQVRRDLLSWSADRWANVAPGSIYHALKKMTKEGLVAEVTVEESDAGPERTVYRLTDDGETEFMMLVTRAISEPERGAEALNAGVTFLPTLARGQAISLLEARLTRLAGQAAESRQVRESRDGLGKPPHVRELFRLWEYSIDGAVRWTKQLIERLESGEYTMADDPGVNFGGRAREPAEQPS
jgi:DNA-binding PadR family transcriptional regulator